MSTKVFQIALVDMIPARGYEYFNASAKNIITYTLWDYLAQIAGVSGGFIPGPGWSISSANLKPYDVVVYFVTDPGASVTGKASAASPSGSNLGGWTTTSPGGVVCEAYVDGNMPARRIANIAFHEIMHNKLDVGATVVADLHGLGDIATPPTKESTKLGARNARFMGQHLFRAIPQYTGAMK